MEIVLSKFSYIENKSSSIEKKYFESVDIKIEEGKIVSFVNDDLSILGKLLLVIKRPSSGVIRFDSVRVSRSSHIHNSKALRRRMGYLNMDTEVMFLEPTVKKEITEVLGNVTFYDGSIGVSKQLDRIIRENGFTHNGKGNVLFFDSSHDIMKEKRFKSLLEGEYE